MIITFLPLYIYTFLYRLSREFAPVEGVPGGPPPNGGLASAKGHINILDSRRFPVAEVKDEGTDTSCLVAGDDAAELEVSSLCTEAGSALDNDGKSGRFLNNS